MSIQEAPASVPVFAGFKTFKQCAETEPGPDGELKSERWWRRLVKTREAVTTTINGIEYIVPDATRRKILKKAEAQLNNALAPRKRGRPRKHE